jgi:hypothetical protein
MWYNMRGGESMESEQWKPVIGYEGLYEVSNIGRVKSIERTITRKNGWLLPIPEKMLSIRVGKRTERHPMPRLYTELWRDNKPKACIVARLVCAAFNENKDNKPQVNHIDGNSANNNADNLEWVTARENNIHAIRNNLVSRPKKRIRGVNLVSGETLDFESLTKAAEFMGVTKNAINAGIHGYGRAKYCKGYKWEYLD